MNVTRIGAVHSAVAAMPRATVRTGRGFWSDLGHQVRDSFVTVAGSAVGYAELLGARFPVHPYRAMVSPLLCRGSRPQPGGIEFLNGQGFKAIVNLCAENDDDAAAAARLGMSALRLPIIDNTPPTRSQILQFLAFVTRPDNQPAYVHCEAGEGRTGVAVACYRMAVQGWDTERAVAEAQGFGLKMPKQMQFIRQFGQDLAAGKIAGYPLPEDPVLSQPVPIDRELEIVTGTRATAGNRIEALIDGERALPRILNDIDAATSTICYETYKFVPGDPVSEQIADHLIAAHRRGVQVRIVVDAFGSREIPGRDNVTLERLAAAGVAMVAYNPIDSVSDLNPHRDHRKVIVIDGGIAYLGGMNTGEDFMGDPSVPDRRHDVFARMVGPAVTDLLAGFLDSWRASGGAAATIPARPAVPQPDGVSARIVAHVPGQDENIRAAYLTLINRAEDHLYIENSYPMTEDLLNATAVAARRGVRVQYIMGADAGPLSLVARDGLRKLLAAGVEIYVYPGRVHTKSVAADGRLATFGSSNLDAVALVKNREVIAIVDDPAFCAQYERDLFGHDLVGDDRGNATIRLRELPDSFWQRLGGSLLDLWPSALRRR